MNIKEAARKEVEEKLHGPFLKWYAENYPEQWETKKKKIGNDEQLFDTRNQYREEVAREKSNSGR